MFEPFAAKTVEALIEGFYPPPARPRTAVWGVYHRGQNRYHNST